MQPIGDRPHPPHHGATSTTARRCHHCGCTDDDCRGCIERTGRPCHWAAEDLCSACDEELDRQVQAAIGALIEEAARLPAERITHTNHQTTQANA